MGHYFLDTQYNLNLITLFISTVGPLKATSVLLLSAPNRVDYFKDSVLTCAVFLGLCPNNLTFFDDKLVQTAHICFQGCQG